MNYDDWKPLTLSELCEIRGGKRLPKGHNLVEYRTKHPYIRVRDLNNLRNIEINDEIQYITKETFTYVKNYIVNHKDILLSIVGSVGLVSLVGKSMDRASLTENCVKLTNFRDGVDTNFLYYYLKSRDGVYEIEKGTVGAVQAKLPIKNIKNIRIKLPSFEKQNAIANILSSLDDKIELNNKINRNLEKLAQTLYKHWFVDFEFPNENGEPYKSSGGEMVDSELGLIPKGFEISRLGDGKISKLVKTGIDQFNNQKVYIATADVTDTQITDYSTSISIDERPSRANMQPKENTVWFAKMKNSRKLIRVSTKSDYKIQSLIFSTGFAGIESKIALNYLWSFVASKEFDELKNSLANGTTMEAINNTNIQKIPFLVPDNVILNNFEEITNDIYNKVEKNQDENQKLAEIRDTLLPKLMNGEIEVPV